MEFDVQVWKGCSNGDKKFIEEICIIKILKLDLILKKNYEP